MRLFSSYLVDTLIVKHIGEAPIPYCRQPSLSPEGRIQLEQYFDVG